MGLAETSTSRRRDLPASGLVFVCLGLARLVGPWNRSGDPRDGAVEFAETEYETQTGLMYRESMNLNQGMLFIFPDERIHSFYMKNTKIPLDLIFIKADSTIASFQENAEAFNESGLSSQVPVKYVLEVNAGLAQKWLLEIGDKIEFTKN